MLRLKTVHCVWRAALAAALAWGASAQPESAEKQLAEAQELRTSGRFAEARTIYLDVLHEVLKNPSAHRLAALVLDNLGVNEQDRGEYSEAETAFNQGLAMVHAKAANDPILISLKTHLAELYIAESRPADAEAVIRPAVTALRSSSSPDRAALAIAYEDLAVVCILRRKFEEAETLLRQSQATVETDEGPDHPRLAASLLTYAGLLTAEHRYAEAVVSVDRAMKILRNAIQITKPYLASALSVAGVVYYRAGHSAEAQSSARECVELAEASLGPNHPRMVLYLSNYSVILKRAGRKNEAKEMRKRADEISGQASSSSSGGYTISAAALH